MGKKLLMVLVIVAVIIVSGLGGYLYYRMSYLPAKAAEEAKENTYAAGDFTVNLDEPGYKKYIKVKMYFGYKGSKLAAELPEKTPQIRNAVNNILRTKKVEDVSSTSHMDEVLKEIQDKINTILTAGKITNIYLTEILIQ